MSEENLSDFQKKKVRAELATDFPTIDERDKTHQVIMVEPLLEALGYRTWRNILRIMMGSTPCHCLAQTFWYP